MKRTLLKKSATFFFILMYLSSFCIAQDDWEEENYGEGEGFLDIDYSNPDEYITLTGDDWNNIDWNKVDFNMLISSGNEEMYSSSQFYQNIPDHEYQNLDYSQIEYTAVDWNRPGGLPAEFHSSLATDQGGLDRYCQQVGNGCSLDVTSGKQKESDKLVFDGKGIRLNVKPSQSVPDLNGLPSGTGIEVRGGKIHILVPPGKGGHVTLDKNSIPPGTRATIESSGSFIINTPNGKEVQVGASELKVHNGEFIVPAGEMAFVNGLEINANEDVTLYGVGTGPDSQYFLTLEKNGRLDDIFNNKKFSKGNSIFTTENSLVMNGVGGDFQNPPYSVTFTEENPYLNIAPATEGIFGIGSKEFDDHLIISPSGGGIVMSKDDKSDGLPNVKTTAGVTIDNGLREINTVEGNKGEVLVFSKSDLRQEKPLTESVEMNLGLGIPSSGQSVTINEGNTIKYGDDVQYASVELDPYNLLPHKNPTVGGVYIDSNLDAQPKNVEIIMMTPPHDETDAFFYEKAMDVILENIPPGTYPLVLDLSESENVNFIDSNKAMLESLNDPSGLGKIPAIVVGHSGQVLIYDEYGNPKSALTVSAGVKDGVDVEVEMDRDVSLGCSIVNQIVSDYRTKMIKYLNGDLSEEEMSEYGFLFGEHEINNLHRGYGGIDKNGNCKNGDYCIQGDAIAYKDDKTRRDMNKFLKDYMISESPYDELYQIETDKYGNIISGMRTSDLPIYAAMAMERRKPGNQYKSEQDLMYALKAGSGFKFPDCHTKERAETLYQEAFGKKIKYAPTIC